jgi:hypothetical protein
VAFHPRGRVRIDERQSESLHAAEGCVVTGLPVLASALSISIEYIEIVCDDDLVPSLSPHEDRKIRNETVDRSVSVNPGYAGRF